MYLYMGDDIDDRAVLRMRSSGMKIEIETKNFDGLPPFNAVLVATGAGREGEDFNSNISKFLRELETAAHDSWNDENVKKEEIKEEARLVLRHLHRWVREEVRNRVPQDDGTPIDIFGLNRILPNVVEEGSEQIPESAVLNFVPIPIGTKETGKKGKDTPLTKDVNGRGKKPDPDPRPRPEPDPNREIRPRNNHQREKIIAVPLQLREVRTPYIPEINSYRISIVPDEDASMMLLKVRISGDDSAMFDVDVISAQIGTRKLGLKDGYIHVPRVKAGNRYTCDFTLSDKGSYALEVKAYAEK